MHIGGVVSKLHRVSVMHSCGLARSGGSWGLWPGLGVHGAPSCGPDVLLRDVSVMHNGFALLLIYEIYIFKY